VASPDGVFYCNSPIHCANVVGNKIGGVMGQPASLNKVSVVRNRAQCAKCGVVIESKHRHDWVACACGAIFVDGGHDYARRGGNPEDIIDMTEWPEEEPDAPE
jgi:ribosomal protein S27AE